MIVIKNKMIKNAIFTMCAMILVLGLRADARAIPEGCELLRCTCYVPTGNRTADGSWPYEGICASNNAHMGQVAAVYTQDMEFIGYFECRDTGSHAGLQNGSRIDIFRNDMDGVKEWQKTVGDYVIVQWIEGEG